MGLIDTARNPFRIPMLQIDDSGNWSSDDPTKGGIDPVKGEFLSFGLNNAKLKALRKAAAKRFDLPIAKVKVLTLTLPAGWSCPGANECLAFADPETGKIWDSPSLIFRCFAASDERYPDVRRQNCHNFNLLRRLERVKDPVMDMPVSHYVTKRDQYQTFIVDSIENAMVKYKVKADDYVIIRIHVGGDFFSKSYLLGWSDALAELDYVQKSTGAVPRIVGYAYSKSMHHIADWFESKGLNPADLETPENFVLTASRGGKFDWLIDEIGLKESVVVFSEEEAESKGLEPDHDDSHAVWGKESFGLLIHGTQPKGSEAAKAKVALEAKGVKAGYNNS